MSKFFDPVYNNGKCRRTILRAPGCALPETSINEGKEGLTKFCSMFAEKFKELDWVHTCPAVTNPQKREAWTHQPHGAVDTDTEDRN